MKSNHGGTENTEKARRILHAFPVLSVFLCFSVKFFDFLAIANQGGILWKIDYEEALVQAGKQQKLLVVHFWLEGRPLVKSMNDETFAHPDVTRLSNAGFVNVKVD